MAMAIATGLTAQQVAEREAIFREMLEEEILRNFEMIQASNEGTGAVVSSFTELKNWAALETTLKILAFTTSEEDPRAFLGIPTSEGPAPSIEAIDQRANMATLLATGASTTAWSEEDTQNAAAWVEKVEKARKDCQGDLGRVTRERRQ